MIKCTRCKKSKPESDFYKDGDKKSGFSSECKECNIAYMKKYYAKNKDKVKAYHKEYYSDPVKRERNNRITTERRRLLLARWEGFIPKVTQCEMCGKDIYFNTNDMKISIHFDHRNGGGELIQGLPSVWLKRNNRTPENEAIWKSCNFGMLCLSCNSALPTRDRHLFLENATKYIKGV
jgi:hypothetical protein